MRKVRGILSLLAMCACIWSCLQLDANASEEVVSKNNIMIAEKDIEIKESADKSAETLQVLEKGAYVYVEHEVDDGWCLVKYQNISGYVKSKQLKEVDIDLEALKNEMDNIELEGKIVIEEVERVRTEQTRSYVWIIVVVVVLLGIIVTGILCASLQKGKKRRRRRRRR